MIARHSMISMRCWRRGAEEKSSLYSIPVIQESSRMFSPIIRAREFSRSPVPRVRSWKDGIQRQAASARPSRRRFAGEPAWITATSSRWDGYTMLSRRRSEDGTVDPNPARRRSRPIWPPRPDRICFQPSVVALCKASKRSLLSTGRRPGIASTRHRACPVCRRGTHAVVDDPVKTILDRHPNAFGVPSQLARSHPAGRRRRALRPNRRRRAAQCS